MRPLKFEASHLNAIVDYSSKSEADVTRPSEKREQLTPVITKEGVRTLCYRVQQHRS